MTSRRNPMFVFNIENVIDIITNSSSELFILKAETIDIVKEMVSNIYPSYLNEYHDIVALNAATDDQIGIYASYNFLYFAGSYNATKKEKVDHYKNVAEDFNMCPQEFYNGWDDDLNRFMSDDEKYSYFYPEISSAGYQAIKLKLDPDGKIFMMFSKGENPDWEYQEKLEMIADRHHLG